LRHVLDRGETLLAIRAHGALDDRREFGRNGRVELAHGRELERRELRGVAPGEQVVQGGAE